MNNEIDKKGIAEAAKIAIVAQDDNPETDAGKGIIKLTNYKTFLGELRLYRKFAKDGAPALKVGDHDFQWLYESWLNRECYIVRFEHAGAKYIAIGEHQAQPKTDWIVPVDGYDAIAKLLPVPDVKQDIFGEVE